MSDEQDFWRDAQKFAAQFSGFVKGAQMFGELGSFKQAVEEAKAERERLLGECEAVRGDIEAAKSEAAKIREQAGTDAKSAVEAAKSQARQLLSAAQQEVASAKAAVDGHKNEIGRLLTEIDTKTRKIVDLDALIGQRKDDLEEIKRKHAEFRASVGL